MHPILRPAAALAAIAMVAGCVQPPPDPTLVEICDSSGCRVQDDDVVTYDPAQAVPEEDPDGILPILEAEAEADPRAAFDLAMRYMRGDGIRQNSYKAVQWMREAGARGDPKAISALGRLYLTGLEEMGPDYNEAQKWLSMAAARGDREAATLLEEAEAGRTREQAYERALRRWRRGYTRPYWYSTRYYGHWRPGWRGYRYY